MEELNKEVKALVDKLGKKEKEWFHELMEGDGDEEGEGDLTRVQAAFLPRTRRERGIVQTNGVMVREGWMGVFRWFARSVFLAMGRERLSSSRLNAFRPFSFPSSFPYQ